MKPMAHRPPGGRPCAGRGSRRGSCGPWRRTTSTGSSSRTRTGTARRPPGPAPWRGGSCPSRVALRRATRARCPAELVTEAGVAEEGVEGAHDLLDDPVDALDVVEGDVDLLGSVHQVWRPAAHQRHGDEDQDREDEHGRDDVQHRVLGHRRCLDQVDRTAVEDAVPQEQGRDPEHDRQVAEPDPSHPLAAGTDVGAGRGDERHDNRLQRTWQIARATSRRRHPVSSSPRRSKVTSCVAPAGTVTCRPCTSTSIAVGLSG
jgi:hypothetical protein